MTVGDTAFLLNEDPFALRRKLEIFRQQATGQVLTRDDITGAYTPITDDAGNHLSADDVADVNWTLTNDLVKGIWFIVTQTGAGRVTFLAGAGATVNTALTAARTRAQWSQVRVDVISNTTGSNAVYVISGDAG